MVKKNNSKTLTFENAMKELESIAEKLSKGDIPLDDSVKLFERGMKMRKLCSEQLNQATGRIMMLIEKSGEFKVEDLEVKENE